MVVCYISEMETQTHTAPAQTQTPPPVTEQMDDKYRVDATEPTYEQRQYELRARAKDTYKVATSSGGIIASLLGAGTTILTVLNLNGKSQTKNFKAGLTANPLNVEGDNQTQLITSLSKELKKRVPSVDLTKAAERVVSKLTSIQKNNKLSSDTKAELKEFLDSSPKNAIGKIINHIWPDGKDKGVLNTAGRAAGATIVTGAKVAERLAKGSAETFRRIAFDLGNKKGKREEAATDIKIKKSSQSF